MCLVRDDGEGNRLWNEGGPRRHGQSSLAGPIHKRRNIEAGRGARWEDLWRALSHVGRIRLRVSDPDLNVYGKVARSRGMWDARGPDVTLAWSKNGHQRQQSSAFLVLLALTIEARVPRVRRQRIRPIVPASNQTCKSDQHHRYL